MANDVRRTAIHSFKDPSHIGGQIVHSYAAERAAALSSTAHVNRDDLQPSGSEHASQMLKINRCCSRHSRATRPECRTRKWCIRASRRRLRCFDAAAISLSRDSADVRCLKAFHGGPITILSARYRWTGIDERGRAVASVTLAAVQRHVAEGVARRNLTLVSAAAEDEKARSE
jgi:hypothetical protein